MSEIGFLEEWEPVPLKNWVFLEEKCEKCGHPLVRNFYYGGVPQ